MGDLLATLVSRLAALDAAATLAVAALLVGALAALAAVVGYRTWRRRATEITTQLTGRQIIETMQEALLVTDAGRIVRLANPAACSLLQCSERAVLGRPIADLLADPQLAVAHGRLFEGRPVRHFEIECPVAQNGQRTLALNATMMTRGDGKPAAIVHVLTDVTERRQAESRVQYLAYYDDLTELPNRNAFMARLEAAVEGARSGRRPVIVYYLDLDNFKRINDSFGHNAGDQLLGLVAERLREFQRRYISARDLAAHDADHSLAYLGGDEFAMMLSDQPDLTEVLRVAKYMQGALREPFFLNGQEVFVGASIGVSRHPQSGEDPQTLLKHANIAMYHAKEFGSNGIQIHDESMNAGSLARLDLERDLRLALRRNEFELCYQPQVDARTGQIVGCEALLRWQHPERGTIAPLEFIGLAEDSGLIGALGQWVLGTASRQAKAWLDAGFEIRVAVNVSARQFRQGSLSISVAQALTRAGLPARYLDIELTESAIMRNVEEASITLRELNSMGVSLSLDDFGTGYSSLSYLKRFPIDVIKIDRSFVHDILQSPDDFSITEAIIAMGRSLNRTVIAEGVETPQQAGLLQRLGCDLMQGYLYSPPLPAEAFGVLLERGAINAVAADPEIARSPAPGRFV